MQHSSVFATERICNTHLLLLPMNFSTVICFCYQWTLQHSFAVATNGLCKLQHSFAFATNGLCNTHLLLLPRDFAPLICFCYYGILQHSSAFATKGFCNTHLLLLPRDFATLICFFYQGDFATLSLPFPSGYREAARCGCSRLLGRASPWDPRPSPRCTQA